MIATEDTGANLRSRKKSTQESIHPLGWGVPPIVLSSGKPNMPFAAVPS